MASALPESVNEFLTGRRFVVAGVSRDSRQPANAILRKLASSGFDVVPVNPSATELEGRTCYPDLRSVPGEIDGVVVATHPAVSADIVKQASERGVKHVWFHRSFGDGSVSQDAIAECEKRGIEPIVGGCPLMYCRPVDLGHRCVRWWLGRKGRIPR